MTYMKGLKANACQYTYKLHDCIMLYWQLKKILLWKSKFNPCDPKLPPGWPLTHNLNLEGLKLMYMHESYTSSKAM